MLSTVEGSRECSMDYASTLILIVDYNPCYQASLSSKAWLTIKDVCSHYYIYKLFCIQICADKTVDTREGNIHAKTKKITHICFNDVSYVPTEQS